MSGKIIAVLSLWAILKLVEFFLSVCKKKLERDIDQLTEQLIRDEHKRHFDR